MHTGPSDIERQLAFVRRGLLVPGLLLLAGLALRMVLDDSTRASLGPKYSIIDWAARLLPLAMIITGAVMPAHRPHSRKALGERIVRTWARACVQCGYPLSDRLTRARCTECGQLLTRPALRSLLKYIRTGSMT